MPTYRITSPDGKEFDVTAPDGASEADVMTYAQRNFKLAAAPKPQKPFGQQLNDFVADVPRQVGLTARYGLEGAGDILDFAATPFRAGLNALGANAKPGAGRMIANSLGLPQPQTSGERVIGDASRMLAGGALPIGAAAQLAKSGTGTAAAVGRLMAANPAQQLASAGSAGAAGGYTRETGGNDTSQLIASLAAGVGAQLAMSGAKRGIDAAAGLGRRLGSAPPASAVNIDLTINNALQPSGMTLSDLSADVAKGIRADVAKAMQTGENLSSDAVRRLADYRLTGLTPTRAGLTLDPADVTQQRNLAQLGINSKDRAAQALGQTQGENNRRLTAGLNTLGANTGDDAIAGGSKIMGALEQRNDRVQGVINKLYEKARDSSGRSAPLDHHAFSQRAGDLLNEKNVESFLTPDIRNKLNKFSTGEIPLNVDIAEQFKSSIAAIQRGSADGNVRTALGAVRQALDDAPLLNQSPAGGTFGGGQLTVPGSLGAPAGQSLGQEALDAFTRARATNRKWMSIVDKTPALQAVRDGIEPDKFVQQFILGGGKANVMDVAMLKNSIKGSPEAMTAVKEQITSFLKQRALSGAADEAGNFSQSGYNKALGAIGERKLRLFFQPDEINQMKAIGRVASYEQFQPPGSAVNNSNTAGALGGILERIGGISMLSKLPFGRAAIGEPLENVVLGMQAKRSMNVPAALSGGSRNTPFPLPLRVNGPGMPMSPAALMAPHETEEERVRRLLTAGR